MNTPQQKDHEGWASAKQNSGPKKASEILEGTVFRNIKMPPPEEMERRKKESDDFNERQRQGRVSDLRQNWGAPKRHFLLKPEREGEWGKKLGWLESKIGTGFLVALVGSPGPGKTQMAVECMKIVTESERSALFSSATNFFLRARSAMNRKDGESELSVLTEFKKPRLVVIDEFEKRAESQWESNLMFELINSRYGDLKDTILIDNRKKEDFVTAVGPPLADRMKETGGIIECNWESFRK